MRGRRLALALSLAFAAAAGGALALERALEPVETLTVDWRYGLRGDREAPRDVVILAIDQASLDRLGSYPFDRRLHARAIDGLRRAGARTIAYDVDFSEESRFESDLALAEAADRARPVTFALGAVPEGPRFIGIDGAEREVGAQVGFAGLEVGLRGKAREIERRSKGLPTFAYLATGRPPWPIAADERSWIDFAGPPGTIRSVPFWRAVRGELPPAAVRGRIVVVGATAPSLLDALPTPMGDEVMPGVEIQANAISTILRDFPLRDAPDGVGVALTLLLAALAPAGALRRSATWALGLPALGLAALAAGAHVAFEEGTVVPVVTPAVAAVISTLLAGVALQRLELRERRRVREAFARFVPDAIVERALERAGDDLRLEGETLTATIMFVDLRGSTTAAETRPARDVIESVNVFLAEMTDAVLAQGGTVAGYRGDGLMALWGAPVPSEDHADRALAAARDMLERLPGVNERLGDRFGGPLRMGIGVNTGEVSSGTVGSSRRLEYAAIGDATNVAARLEGLTKDVGRPVVVADSTVDALTGSRDGLEKLGALEIRGRAETVEAWTFAPAGAG